MTRRQWIGFWLVTASTVPACPGFADSIWDRRDQRSAYLFMDDRARRVGDLLLVVVNENTGATNNEQRKLQKDTAASGKLDFAGKTVGGVTNSAAANLSADATSDRSFNGTAQYQSNRQLSQAQPFALRQPWHGWHCEFQADGPDKGDTVVCQVEPFARGDAKHNHHRRTRNTL